MCEEPCCLCGCNCNNIFWRAFALQAFRNPFIAGYSWTSIALHSDLFGFLITDSEEVRLLEERVHSLANDMKVNIDSLLSVDVKRSKARQA